jgi:hypothetical protein
MKARMMTLPHSRDRCYQLADVDKAWQQERLGWLDWDREPQPLGICSVAITTVCFLVLWSLLLVVDRTFLGPAAATVSVLMLYSPRAAKFTEAFLDYQRRRAALV